MFLSFDFATFLCTEPNSLVVNVIVGGVNIGTLDCTLPFGTFGPIDIAPFGIPTGPTTILIEGIELPSDIGVIPPAIFIDNVSLATKSCPEIPSICDLSIEDVVFTCPNGIPTMGEWGLICLTLLLIIFGIVAIESKSKSIVKINSKY